MFYPEGFANFALEKSFIPKLVFFYTIEVCENGYSQNIVTTSLFMTLLRPHHMFLHLFLTPQYMASMWLFEAFILYKFERFLEDILQTFGK